MMSELGNESGSVNKANIWSLILLAGLFCIAIWIISTKERVNREKQRVQEAAQLARDCDREFISNPDSIACRRLDRL